MTTTSANAANLSLVSVKALVFDAEGDSVILLAPLCESVVMVGRNVTQARVLTCCRGDRIFLFLKETQTALVWFEKVIKRNF